jgi:hypothetical protein
MVKPASRPIATTSPHPSTREPIRTSPEHLTAAVGS